ncbi:hypothetical protein PDE_08284 [Penicillium oxalicum 114-2]|uniref:Uncharacterized protein n=1 Tax=Penicillium oxalicum (strain 114-2 / CGMCC 5302) TaxID=933388 RepID=S8BE62_PENO1|nr:hypothetical protein PDE_08284 [Penicillium oxalicum 114-2]
MTFAGCTRILVAIDNRLLPRSVTRAETPPRESPVTEWAHGGTKIHGDRLLHEDRPVPAAFERKCLQSAIICSDSL